MFSSKIIRSNKKLLINPVKGSLIAMILLLGIMRLIIFLVVHYWSTINGNAGFSPIDLGGDDGKFYFEEALIVVENKDTETALFFFSKFIASAMWFFGTRDVFFLKSFNTVLVFILLFISYQLIKLILNSQKVFKINSYYIYIGILLIGLYPSSIAFTTISLFRDGYIYVLHLTVLYFIIKSLILKYRFGFFINSIFTIIFIVLLSQFRWYTVISIIVGFTFWVAYNAIINGKKRGTFFKSIFQITLLVFSVITIIFSSDVIFGIPFTRLLEYRDGFSSINATTNLGISFNYSNPFSFITSYLYSFISNVFGPFPWQLSSPASLLVFLLETPVFIYISIKCWSLRKYFGEYGWLVFFQALSWFLLISFSNDNIGTSARLRVIGWNCIFILYSIALINKNNRKTLELD